MSYMAERETIKNTHHRNNIVKIINYQGNDFKALIYEFIPNGSLKMWLHQIPESRANDYQLHNLSMLQRINISIDVASGLDYLHHHCQSCIVHCDLKPSNILLDRDMSDHV